MKNYSASLLGKANNQNCNEVLSYLHYEGADNNQQKTIIGGDLTLTLSLQEFKI